MPGGSPTCAAAPRTRTGTSLLHVGRRLDPDLGKHGVRPGPWRSRARQPFQLDGFTLRFVVIPVAFAGLAVVLGVLALASGRASGGIEVLVGLLVLGLAAVYFKRPVNRR